MVGPDLGANIFVNLTIKNRLGKIKFNKRFLSSGGSLSVKIFEYNFVLYFTDFQEIPAILLSSFISFF